MFLSCQVDASRELHDEALLEKLHRMEYVHLWLEFVSQIYNEVMLLLRCQVVINKIEELTHLELTQSECKNVK